MLDRVEAILEEQEIRNIEIAKKDSVSSKYDIKELQASQKEETKALVDAVNNNTLVIQQLVDKMNKEG